ncbi:hypothetical protein AJ88_46745 [Mesorhizobium amorphae CCBAU 01583]|nr:hypothetical protein AJ88_46745 [Mesorhizobium amorphae CCBAU 01583]
MAGVDFKEMDLSRNYRSSERIVGYFGNYNVYATKISAEGKDRQYASLISFDPVTARDGLERSWSGWSDTVLKRRESRLTRFAFSRLNGST